MLVSLMMTTYLPPQLKRLTTECAGAPLASREYACACGAPRLHPAPAYRATASGQFNAAGDESACQCPLTRAYRELACVVFLP